MTPAGLNHPPRQGELSLTCPHRAARETSVLRQSPRILSRPVVQGPGLVRGDQGFPMNRIAEKEERPFEVWTSGRRSFVRDGAVDAGECPREPTMCSGSQSRQPTLQGSQFQSRLALDAPNRAPGSCLDVAGSEGLVRFAL